MTGWIFKVDIFAQSQLWAYIFKHNRTTYLKKNWEVTFDSVRAIQFLLNDWAVLNIYFHGLAMW